MPPLPRIALAQMEVLPGRPDLNCECVLALMDEARHAGVQVVAFPEMCIPGYILGDIWECDALVEDFAAYSDVICRASHGLTVLFGNVALDPEQIGEDGRRRKFNAAHVWPGLFMSCTTSRLLVEPTADSTPSEIRGVFLCVAKSAVNPILCAMRSRTHE